MPLIPKGDAVNSQGDPLDILEVIRAKKEIGRDLLPFCLDHLKELKLYTSDPQEHEEINEGIQKIRQIADQMGIELGDDLPGG